MDFRQLETFVEVINLKSFSKAANKLFLTQPTITSHIQNLEKEIGTQLLNRSNKNISPTDAGNILYKYAQDIINMRDTAQFKLGKYKGIIEGNLEISSSSIPKQYILPYILKDFFSKYPNISIDITHSNSKSVVNDIINSNIDFGIVGAKYNLNNLEYIKLIKDRLVLVTPNNKKYKNIDKIDIQTLLKENLIIRRKGSGSRLLLEKSLNNIDLSLNDFNIVATTENNETIKKFIDLDIGISFISELAVREEVKKGLFKIFDIDNLNLNRNFYFVYHKNRHLSPLAETFKNFMIHRINKKNID